MSEVIAAPTPRPTPRRLVNGADHPLVGEVRGMGLMAALEFVADKDQKQRFDPALKVPGVSAAALEQGLIARAMPHGDIPGFSPLVVTPAEVEETVAIVKRAVDNGRAAPRTP